MPNVNAPPVVDPHGPTERKWRAVLMLRAGYDTDDVADTLCLPYATVRAWAAHRTMGTYDKVEEVTLSWAWNKDRIGRAILELAVHTGSLGVPMRKFDVPPVRLVKWVMSRLNAAGRTQADEVAQAFARAGFPPEPPVRRKAAPAAKKAVAK